MKRQGLLIRMIGLFAAIVLAISGMMFGSKLPSSAADPSAQGDTAWRTDSTNVIHDGASRTPVLYQVLGNNSRIDTNGDELRIDFVLRVAHGEVDPGAPTNGNTGLRIAFDFGGEDGATGDTNFNNHAPGTNGNKWLNPQYRPAAYMNTIGTTGTYVPPVKAADAWAQNQNDYYTIHSVMSSAPYDFLVISLEADLNLLDDNSGARETNFWNNGSGTYTSNPATANSPNGALYFPKIYTEVGPDARGEDDNNPINNCVGKKLRDHWTGDLYGSNGTTCMDASPFSTNIGKNLTWTVYPGFCTNPSGTIHHGCQMPNVHLPYDQHPYYWSGGQSNWGLVTDAGLGGDYGSYKGSPFADGQNHYWYARDWPGIPQTAPGVAPANSFSIYWYDPARDAFPSNPCYNITKFKYQWVALQNGNRWVPVTALTPNAEEGQQLAAGSGNPPVPTGIGQYNAVASFNSKLSAATTLLHAAGNNSYYTSSDPAPLAKQNLIATDASGNLTPAQNADGSIDFDKASNLQANDNAEGHPGDTGYKGLDGYYKLVTWPEIDTSGGSCPTIPSDIQTDKGVTADMTQAQAQQEIDKGWTVGTAFDKFDVARPKTPTILTISDDDADTAAKEETFKDFSDEPTNPQIPLGDNRNTVTDSNNIIHDATSHASEPTLHGGHGVPGDVVHLYYDVPNRTDSSGAYTNRIMLKNDADSNVNGDKYDNFGTEVGTATVAADGTWSIQDTTAVDTTQKGERVRRYHAYEIDPNDDMKVVSHTSDISVANFATPPDPVPTFNSIVAKPDGTHSTADVPHTVLNTSNNTAALPAGSKIKISGTVSSLDGGSSLHIYAKGKVTPSSSSPNGMELTGDSNVTCSIGNTSGTYSVTNLPQGSTTWQCTIDPSWFAGNVATQGDQWTFSAVSQNPGGNPSAAATQSSEVNIFAPKPGMTSADWRGVTGTAIPADSDAQAGGVSEEGATVTVTWPNGTSSTTTIDNSSSGNPNGYWHIDMPAGMTRGQVTVKMTDGSSNQSVAESRYMIPEPALSSLPFTGGRLWWLVAVAAAGLAGLAYEGLKKLRAALGRKPHHAK